MSEDSTGPTTRPDDAEEPVLRVVRGNPTEEETAALVVVLQGLASASAATPPTRPRSEWSAHHRKLRVVFPSGPGGWRSSGMPR